MLNYIEDSKLNNSSVIWRYMDYEKFLDLLMTKELFFSFPGRQLDDLNEGMLGVNGLLTLRYSSIFLENFKNSLENLKNERDNYGILCWHKHTAESLQMWKLYTAGGKGVAIKTTVGKLKNYLINLEEDSWINKVSYNSEKLNNFHHFDDIFPSILFYKDPIYKSESEVRAVIKLNEQKGKKRNKFSINLDDLIDEAIMSPFSFMNTEGHLKKIAERFNALDPHKIRTSTCLTLREERIEQFEPQISEEIEEGIKMIEELQKTWK